MVTVARVRNTYDFYTVVTDEDIETSIDFARTVVQNTGMLETDPRYDTAVLCRVGIFFLALGRARPTVKSESIGGEISISYNTTESTLDSLQKAYRRLIDRGQGAGVVL